VYSCKVYVHIPDKIRQRDRHHKLAPRAKVSYLVGYQSTNIYRIWLPQDDEVRPEKDVIFDETTFFDLQEHTESITGIVVTIEIPELQLAPLEGFILEDFEDT